MSVAPFARLVEECRTVNRATLWAQTDMRKTRTTLKDEIAAILAR